MREQVAIVPLSYDLSTFDHQCANRHFTGCAAKTRLF